MLPLLALLLSCAPGTESPDDDRDGWTTADGDCDDGDAGVHPESVERCNGIDDDCDGTVDGPDASGARPYYDDDDGDGHGDPDAVTVACEPPPGTTTTGLDCDDTDPEVNPYAEEICNGIDDDCDGEADVVPTWYTDADGDGWGDPDTEGQACEPWEDAVDTGGDCDDGDPEVHPGAAEQCNGEDDDCDGEADEDAGEWWYLDADGDGWGDEDDAVRSCEPVEGRVAVAGDCDDGDMSVNPDMTDWCNGEDDDCDGDVDEDHKPSWILVSVDTRGGVVQEIDPSTASTSELSDISGADVSVNSMDVREDGVAIVHDFANGRLMEIDACSGSFAEIGETGVGNTCGIAFGPGGTLYGLDSTYDQLVRYNTTTGAGTAIGSIGFNIGSCGLAYDCTTDTLYGADGSSDRIFELDTSTGAASGFVTTSVPFASVGLEFDHTAGVLYAATGTALYTVDPASGTTTLVGSLSGDLYDDLAWYPGCP